MALNTDIQDLIQIEDAPAIPGLRFRHFRGDEDFPRMVGVIAGSSKADNIERVETADQVRANYEHLTNCDPYKDMVFIEVEGQPNDGVIGYSRVMWWQEEATKHRIYLSFGFLLPEWRRKGIGTAVLKHNQRRLVEIASEHPHDGERFFHTFASDSEVEANRAALKDGYVAVSHGAEMVRPDLENIPDTTLPDGIEVRPVREEDMQAIFEADIEAFRDHWGFSESHVQSLDAWKIEPGYDPSLWRVAWQGDQVVGMVRSFINPLENEMYNRKRGYTEHISVRRPWRRMGVARTLINLSLHALKERGMEEAALGVHVENPNGAFALYESCGFRVTRMNNEYRKPMPE